MGNIVIYADDAGDHPPTPAATSTAPHGMILADIGQQ